MQKNRSFSGMTGAVALCALVAVLGTPFLIHEANTIMGSPDAQKTYSASGKPGAGPAVKTVMGKTANSPLYRQELVEANKKRAAAPAPAPADESLREWRRRAETQRPSADAANAPIATPEGAVGSEAMRAWRQRAEMQRQRVAAEKASEPAHIKGDIQAAGKEELARQSAGAAALVTDMKDKAAIASSTAEAKRMPAASAPMSPTDEFGQFRIQLKREQMQSQLYQESGRDSFPDYKDNGVMEVASDPVSTFSIDVDTSSYSFIRRSINEGHLPPRGAVRLEEMINYFHYNYAVPQKGADPFLPTIAVFDCPWHQGDKLVHIGIKGYVPGERPKSNLVFLIDTSGSMDSPDKLPLLVSSFKLMLDSLKPDDTVGIVTYAGNAGVALEPTPASDKAKILSVLNNLSAGGSTAGAQGLQAAYQLANQAFIKGGNNRILLATDGDFNVGISSQDGLKDLMTKERDQGVYLSVLGFGMGNYQDTTMQTLAQNGNGNASYIDNLSEARKVLVEEASSTLFTIAKDVKIQVEFNPAAVQEYRLIGYETRHLNREDFNNDKIDAGEVGAGHAVTALYEITPVGAKPLVDKLRYGAADNKAEADKTAGDANEYAFLKIRYKKPDSDVSTLMTRAITKDDVKPWDDLSDDSRFATAVAGFGQLLRGSNYVGNLGYDRIIEMAVKAKGKDEDGYRGEFVNLVKLAKSEAGVAAPAPVPDEQGDEPIAPQPVPMIQK